MKLFVSLKKPVGSIEEEAPFSSFISTYPKQPDDRKVYLRTFVNTQPQSNHVLFNNFSKQAFELTDENSLPSVDGYFRFQQLTTD